MSAPKLVIAALALSIASGAAQAVDHYVFDSVSNLDFHPAHPSVTGVLRSSPTPITAIYPNAGIDAVALCMPAMLTMIEKAGRYYLHVFYDPTPGTFYPLTCGLELRS